jgi:hypothetical protein
MKRIIIPMICVLVIALAFCEQLLSIAQAAGPPVKGAIAFNCKPSHTQHFNMNNPPTGWRWMGGNNRSKTFHLTRKSVSNREITCQYGDHPLSPKLLYDHKSKGLVCEAGHPGAHFWCWDKNMPSPNSKPNKFGKPSRR